MTPRPLWVLRDGVRITPVAELPIETGDAGRLAAGSVVSRPHTRFDPTWIDPLSARLAEQFHRPKTLEQALVDFCRTEARPLQEVISEARPLLERLVAKEILVSEGTLAALETPTSFAPGDRFQDATVVRAIATTDDRELYLMRLAEGRFAALKQQRKNSRTIVGPLDHEIRILRHLVGDVAPALLGSGTTAIGPWALLDWRLGIDPVTAAAQWRTSAGLKKRHGLLQLMHSIVQAYASLHERGVLHGDIHPGNLLVAGVDEITILDFGLASLEDLSSPTRGGIAFYYDPELAQASLDEHRAPPLTAASDVYSLCATLYRIATGVSYLRFDLRRRHLLRQIVRDEPLAFSEQGVAAWPELEAILRRGLAKEPADRFSSIAELAERLEGLDTSAPDRSSSAIPGAALKNLVDRALNETALDGPLLAQAVAAPIASLALGAAGVARVLLRASIVRDDPALLACADLWAERANAEEGDTALYAPEHGFTRETIGTISPIYAGPGLPWVKAEVAVARGDSSTWTASVASFLAATGGESQDDDLFFGQSGVLLAIARLAEVDAEVHPDADSQTLEISDPTEDFGKLEPGQEIRAAGRALLEDLNGRWQAEPAMDRSRFVLGMAHGWAGRLYAALRFCAATGMTVPEPIVERVHELGNLAQPMGRGFGWSKGLESPTVTGATWCGGTAGFVHLWGLAEMTLPGAGFGRLVEAAGWVTFDAPAALADLCCGLAGRSYALLDLYRRSGDHAWLSRAKILAIRAAKGRAALPGPSWSLLKGELGICALALDLERPDEATFPIFE